MYSPPETSKVDVYVEKLLKSAPEGSAGCWIIDEWVASLDIHMVRFVDAEVSRLSDKVIC
jgi:hypothetical protein